MSIDLRIGVVGKSKKDILDFIKNQNLGVRCNKKNWFDFAVAGFGYKIYEGKYYTESEVEEAKRDGYYKSYMDLDGLVLTNSTNMGWGWYGNSREMQFPVAEMLAQLCSIYLNCMTYVYDPQSGKITYYRRKNDPQVHKAIDGMEEGFSVDCENFCESREGDDGQWEELGWRAKQRKLEKEQSV